MSTGHQADAKHHARLHHGVDHGSLKGYLTGFGLSVLLTAIPFWLVMSNALGNQTASAIAIMGFAVVQIVVHMVFFLHMNTRSESGWIMMALIFTLILVVITLTGSLWVMYHLNTNMMPGHDMGQMP
ncbi:cytochrome o ubiquinol oxidase subunit IV [Mesorhizobium sp. INR15]|uniref:cytochrome o ubiquinol oxidase subunit IV n=1 Tax=Mesorhizobium sp. INR15 TaxID=2654248 RepID=UPI0018966526|nr:cytochrome o ubiquinol oxidase subunit IV [Mesorhizobium sp. INR15]QPC94715.1 cytochrome o ubiquinol oxidase subunit IV [Mesorhizobium sp. INR15]